MKAIPITSQFFLSTSVAENQAEPSASRGDDFFEREDFEFLIRIITGLEDEKSSEAEEGSIFDPSAEFYPAM